MIYYIQWSSMNSALAFASPAVAVQSHAVFGFHLNLGAVVPVHVH